MYYDKKNIPSNRSELNRARKNCPFGLVTYGDNYGGCYISIDNINTIVEPSKEIIGEIRETYEYHFDKIY